MKGDELRAGWWFGLPLLFLVLSIQVQFGAILNHDVAWYLVAAERMLQGGGYETDFFEFNLPQAIAMQVAPYLMSEAGGIPLPAAARTWVFLLVLQCIVLIAMIQRRCPRPLFQGKQWPLWLSWLLIGLLLLPGYNFGQREHLVIVLGLPFLFMLSQEAAQLPQPVRAYVTALAATGFFLKPHYAPLPFLLLAAVAYRQRSWRKLLTLELAVLLTIGGAFAVWIVAWYPDWFTVAAWALDLYGEYGDMSWRSLVAARIPFVVPCLVVLLALLTDQRFRRHAAPLVVTAAYACFAFFVQMKGWKYHFLPVTLLTFIALGLAVGCGVQGMLGKETRSAAKLAAAGVVALVLAREAVLDTGSMRRSWMMQFDPVLQTLRGSSDGGTVFVFTVEPKPAFPAIAHLDLDWGSRYSTLWPLPRLLRAMHGLEPETDVQLLRKYWEPFAASVAEDLARYRPQCILVELKEFEHILPPGEDIVSLFLNHQGFARIWRRYQRAGEVNGYRVYLRSGGSE